MKKTKYHHFIARTVKTTLAILVIFACYAYISPFISAKYLTKQEARNRVYSSLDVANPEQISRISDKTPRNMFISYYYESLAMWLGFHQYYFDLINSNSADIIQEGDYSRNQENQRIDEILVAMIQTDFVLSDLPEAVSGDELTLNLGHDNPHTFYLKKKSNGDWYFTPKNFDNPQLAEKMDQFIQQKGTDINDIHNASIPILSYMNFIFGANNLLGFNEKDSMSSMVTTWIPSDIAERYSLFTSFTMSKVFESANVGMTDIPGGLAQENSLVMIHKSPLSGRSLYLEHIKDPNSGKYSWLFSEKVQKNSIDMYINDLPLDIPRDPLTYNIRYTIWENIPAMVHEYGPYTYIAILALVSLFLLYITFKFINLISNTLFNALGRLYNNDDTKGYKKISIIISLTISFLTSTFLFFNGALIYPDFIFFIDFFFRVGFGIIIIFLTTEIVNIICSFAISAYTKHKHEIKAARFSFAILIANKVINLILILVLSGAIVQMLGIDMVHFLTALGIGGIALALAGKDTIENLFGSIILAMERPIKIGDWVVIEDKEGTIENIGLRSTTIRTFKDSLLVIPNYTFINSKINNMGERIYRRYMTMLELDESTPTSKLEVYIEKLNEHVDNAPHMRAEGNHIYINEITSSSINILIYVFFVSKNWEEELKQRQAFIIKVLNLAEEMGIKFAPTQKVQLGSIDAFPKQPD